MTSPVVKFKCPACARRNRRQYGDPLEMHSPQELDACMAMRQGISIEEVQRQRESRQREWKAKDFHEETTVKLVTFGDSGRVASVSIGFDNGATRIFMAYRRSGEPMKPTTLPVPPPIGTVLPNCTYGQYRIDEIEENSFESRKLQCRQEELRLALEKALEPFKKTVDEIRMLHLPSPPKLFEEEE